MLHIPHWYIPSFYGDIRLEAEGAKRCRLIAEKTTEREKTALAKLATEASKKGWLPTSSSPAPLFSGDGVLKTMLDAPISKIATYLGKILKPNRTIISAVRFSNGTIEEVHGDIDDSPAAEPARSTATGGSSVDDLAASAVARESKPVAAASVAAPTRGCPAPDFRSADLKAKGVLATFLSPEQLEDFGRYNRFVTVGAETGHRYMVTSRQATDSLTLYQRTLYDLDEERPLCVHDWSIPAAEEMLALHILLGLPHWESFLRSEDHDVELAPELWS